MPSSSPAIASKSRASSSAAPSAKTPLLDPRRLFELLGFLIAVIGLLILLSLSSFLPQDPSLNTASPAGGAVHNWVGMVGSYGADVLFQALGWVAYLVPIILFVVGTRLLLARPFVAPWSKVAGTALLLGSLATLLEQFPYTPPVGGLLRGSGLVGYLLTAGLVHILNRTGAVIVAGTAFLASLFLVTQFSFSAAYEFSRRHLAFLHSLLEPVLRRWSERREARQRERLKRQVERARIVGKQPVIMQRGPVLPGPEEGIRKTNAPAAAEAEYEELEPVSLDSETEGVPLGGSAASIVHARGPREESSCAPSSAPRIVGRGPHAYKLPSPTLLRPPDEEEGVDEDELKERAVRLTEKFKEFGVTGTVTQIHPGPVVTTFEFKPEAGIKYSRITNLVDDLCLAMKAESILIERVPGKSTVGIEVPNLHREIIHLRELVESSEFASSPSRLTLSMGKDITGKMKVSDLTQMPHLLIAGSTGAGKSVAINSMIVSMLYKSTPEEVKLILIDPKRLELCLYDGIPHLLTPIVTEPKQAANVLRRATVEMEKRLRKLAEHGVRSIEQFNKIFEPDSTLNLFDTTGERERPLPYIVIVIDELADLMMVEPLGVEESITRLAQMARAVGIHLILATQRPSVDVITGLIKANLPSRMSFRVASKVDSRTILDSNGAEALLGRGDMLFLPPGTARLIRLHGPLVTESEIGRVVEWWKAQSQPLYNQELLQPFREKENEEEPDEQEEDSAELDEVYEEAVRLVVESGKASTSLLQRRLRLGYGRAARLIDMMQKDGIVSAPDGSKPREVLKRPDWLREVGPSMR